jgi:DNA mismatch repair protein MutS2
LDYPIDVTIGNVQFMNVQKLLFDRILTDIGDNQSIENHLSTYSYRLKNMNYFLKKCNDKTMFLIDEFGTGSDPELEVP